MAREDFCFVRIFRRSQKWPRAEITPNEKEECS
jgi:hypothetical protein